MRIAYYESAARDCQPCTMTLAAFLAANAEDPVAPEDVAAIKSLWPSESVTLGGGARGEWRVKRLPDDPLQILLRDARHDLCAEMTMPDHAPHASLVRILGTAISIAHDRGHHVQLRGIWPHGTVTEALEMAAACERERMQAA
jgi:hypothetical protein